MNNRKILNLYQALSAQYGDPIKYWPQWCAASKSMEDREKIIIGMIMVQRTTWHNAYLALKNLKQNNLLSINKIAGLKSLDKLTKLTRSAGFFQSKPKRLFDLCTYIFDNGGVAQLVKNDTLVCRTKFLNLKGVGPETADTILLFALDKPTFIIDEYTRRFVKKNDLTSKTDYQELQEYFENNLPNDIDIYKKLHALIIISQRGPIKSMMEML